MTKKWTKKLWTTEEDRKLQKALDLGISPSVAQIPGRSTTAKFQRAAKLKAWATDSSHGSHWTEDEDSSHGSHWTADEDEALRDGRERGIPYNEINIPGRSLIAKQQRVATLKACADKSFFPGSHWTENEDEALRDGRERGIPYNEIDIPGRSTLGKSARGVKLKLPKTIANDTVIAQKSSNHWTPEEDRRVQAYKDKGTVYKNMEISGRTWSAIKNRWLGFLQHFPLDSPLDSDLQNENKQEKDPIRHNMIWTAEEDKILWDGRQAGKSYSEIKVPGRSTSALMNRWDVWLKKQGEFTLPKVLDLNAHLKNLCKDYTIATLPKDLGDYYYLLDRAAKIGWVIFEFGSSSTTFTSESPTELKTLTIYPDLHLLLEVQSKGCIWIQTHRRIVTGPPLSRHQKIQKFLSRQYFDFEGNEIPSPTK